MRAVSLEKGGNPEQIVRAAMSEIKSYISEESSLEGAILVVHVRRCLDEEKENGATLQRKAQPR